jgi:hypothetical protein
VLAGKSKTAALDNKELPALEFGSMCYMMSKEGYLSDRDRHWHPHLMFFVQLADVKVWGAGLPGSPIFAGEDTPDRLTVFLVPISKWSDGTFRSNCVTALHAHKRFARAISPYPTAPPRLTV